MTEIFCARCGALVGWIYTGSGLLPHVYCQACAENIGDKPKEKEDSSE